MVPCARDLHGSGGEDYPRVLGPDHVPMLVSCPPKMAPAKLMQRSRVARRVSCSKNSRIAPALLGPASGRAGILAAGRLSVGTQPTGFSLRSGGQSRTLRGMGNHRSGDSDGLLPSQEVAHRWAAADQFQPLSTPGGTRIERPVGSNSADYARQGATSTCGLEQPLNGPLCNQVLSPSVMRLSPPACGRPLAKC